MKTVTSVLISSFLLISCSNNIYVKKYEVHQKIENEINYIGAHRSGRVVLEEDRIIEAEKIRIGGDSLTCMDRHTLKYLTVSLQNVYKIKFKDHPVGAVYGLISGAGVGSGIALLTIDRNAEMAGLAAAAYMAGGGLLGVIIGGIFGIDLNYVFINEENN